MVDYKFTPGSTVWFKLRPIFESPDAKKYKSDEGGWSTSMSVDIDVEFTLMLDGKTKTLTIKDDDHIIMQFNKFKERFLNEFNRSLQPDQVLILVAKSNNSSDGDQVLNDKCNLAKYSNSNSKSIWRIEGTIPRPKVIEQPQPVVAEKKLKTQISVIVVYNGNKKRVNLKKKNDDYNIKSLLEKIQSKHAKNGLSGGFEVETDDGKALKTDDDIINILHDHTGALKVKQ